MRPPHRPRTGIRSAALPPALIVALLGVIVSGCGIPVDPNPRSFRVETTSPDIRDATDDANGKTGETATVFVGFRDRVLPVTRRIERTTARNARVHALIEATLQPTTPAEQLAGISSEIPAGTTLTDAFLVNDLVVVDLSGTIAAFESSSALELAVAQLLFSASQLSGVTSLQLRVDGQPRKLSAPGKGDVDTVTVCQYRDLLAAPSDINEANRPIGERDQLNLVRKRVEAFCDSNSKKR